MTEQNVFHKLIDEGATPEDIAALCDVTIGCVHRWTNHNLRPGASKIDLAERWLEEGMPEAWLAGKLPKPEGTKKKVMEVNKAMREAYEATQAETHAALSLPEQLDLQPPAPSFEFLVSCETPEEAAKVRRALDFVKANYLEA